MRLQYLIGFKDQHLTVRIEERGASRKVLYWDTLSAMAIESDREALAFFRKILTRFTRNLETLPFQHIEIALTEASDAMRLIAKTGRVFYQGQSLLCDWQCPAKVLWLGRDESHFSARLQYKEEDIPLESCEKIFPNWCIWQGKSFPFQSPVSWKWIEPFVKGPLFLDGVRKKRFLEEEPPMLWSTSCPRLLLTDPNGCFANLGAENPAWEKDLLEAGYLRKEVGNTRYFAAVDRVQDALLLLLDVGWEIVLADGKKLVRQTGSQWRVSVERGAIAVRATALFGEKKAALKKGKLWIEIDSSSAGLLDRKKGEALEGEWVGETLHLNKAQAAELVVLIEQPAVEWEEAMLQTVRGLKEGAERETALPDPTFRGVLLPHQQKGVDWLAFLQRRGFSGLLADEMGLGKTVQVLAFFSRLRTNLPVLIVAPASLLFHWRSEIERFLPGACVHIHAGSSCSTEGYVITSYARLRVDESLLSQIEWEAIVLDESSAIKTATTQTAQAAYRLNGRFKIALNGTPVENRPEELESQFRFLMPGLIRDKEIDARRIKPFLLRRKKDELDLPEKMEQTVWVEMEEGQSKLYRAYSEGIRTGLLRKIASDGSSVHRMEILEAILRLRQIAADPRLTGSEIGGSKIERLVTDIEEAMLEKRKVLVYSQFTSMLVLISAALNAPFLYLDGSVPPAERFERVRRFQEDPKMPIFLLSLKAGGVGLNLTAADYVFLFDPWWNAAVENQAIDRAHRIGRLRTVIARRYLVPDSIEEKMLHLKVEKRKAADALLENGEGFSWTEEDLLHLLS